MDVLKWNCIYKSFGSGYNEPLPKSLITCVVQKQLRVLIAVSCRTENKIIVSNLHSIPRESIKDVTKKIE